jgi:hypothetical protein
MGTRRRLIQISLSDFFQNIPFFYQHKCFISRLSFVYTQILNITVIINLLNLQLSFIIGAGEKIYKILLIYLDHGATNLCIKAFFRKYLIDYRGNNSIIITKHCISLTTSCITISKDSSIISL